MKYQLYEDHIYTHAADTFPIVRLLEEQGKEVKIFFMEKNETKGWAIYYADRQT